jgi:hypothetical protein
VRNPGEEKGSRVGAKHRKGQPYSGLGVRGAELSRGAAFYRSGVTVRACYLKHLETRRH